VDKMAALGADELIVTSQRTIENNFTREKFLSSLVTSLRTLAEYAEQRGVRVLFRPSYERYPYDLKGVAELCSKVNHKNLYLAPSMAELLAAGAAKDEDLALLKTLNVKYMFVAAAENDINGQLTQMNLPIYKGPQKEIERIVRAFPGAQYMMDGLYGSQDEEYLDVKMLQGMRRK
jgi:sugar phosphate isomerase/epimerase